MSWADLTATVTGNVGYQRPPRAYARHHPSQGERGGSWTIVRPVSGRSDRPVELGGLVFLALGGVVALLQGLPDAVGRLRVSRASLAGLARLPRPVPDPLPRPLGDLLADDLVHASAASRPQPARLTRPNSALSGL